MWHEMKRESLRRKDFVTSLTPEAAIVGVLFKMVILLISQNSRENTCASLFFKKVAGLRCFSVSFMKF